MNRSEIFQGNDSRAGAIGRGAVAVLMAVGGGLVIGGLSSPGQQYLPESVGSIANSVGGWSMFTFLLVWLSRARPVLGAILGVAAFEAMLEGYAIVSEWRGFYYSAPFSSMWVIPGILAGLVLGFGAATVRHTRRPLGRWLSVVPLSLVLVVEGAYGLLVISDTTSPVYWTIEVVAGAVFLALAVWRRRRA
ncbi:DUF6518 family protein [Frondihabitans australicus]|uniref:Uncharacterized protein n=1 Tax=Frondihabitans australicus TaxID=386892 RepID=A0A495IAC6_9MICO|nr:DUF6518 family protein [Frondihabitans australicus]RKR72967.1 hypothetical protein C8E83_0049 [Frondihabitans australicus]